MKIKEFSIRRYGPLIDTGRISLHNFNLFFGKNEDGKTLTIDALVKLLLGRRNIKDFEGIDRVEEYPEGYVVIEDETGEIKLTEKKNLSEIADLTPSECRNIFVIRNSDLSISRESQFYTSITDRLMGLKTEKISKIKKKLKELGKLTREDSTAELSDSQDFGKIRSRLKSAGILIQKIQKLQGELEQEDFDKLEEENIKFFENLEDIRQQIKDLEDAEKREKYENGKEGLDKLKEASEKLDDLKTYNEDDWQSWRDSERAIRTINKEKEGLFTELEKNEKELREINRELEGKDRDFQVLGERKKKLDDDVKPELKNYETGRQELAHNEEKNKLYAPMVLISVILFGISLFGAIINPSPLFDVFSIIFFISTTILLAFKLQFTGNKARNAETFERIKLALSKFELDADSFKNISSNIQKFDEKYDKVSEELQKTIRRKENQEGHIKKLKDETIPHKEREIREAQKKIDEVKRKSGAGSFQEYDTKLTQKKKHIGLAESQKSIMESHFGAKSKTPEENISYWDEKIEEIELYKDRAENIKYDEKVSSSLKEKVKSLSEKLGDLKEKILHFQKRLEDIEKETNKILQLESDYLRCRTSKDLETVGDRLQDFMDRNESNKNIVLKVMEIFEGIELEEKEKVSELFGKNSSISKYFCEITGGIYEEVLFDQEKTNIVVHQRGGGELPAEKLSGGAYDQLYLSIRLALGEKLLKGKKGFFIMDDPFIKADSERLKRLIEMLKKISGLGWQIIYISAKEEVKTVLDVDIKKGTVNLAEIQGIYS